MKELFAGYVWYKAFETGAVTSVFDSIASLLPYILPFIVVGLIFRFFCIKE